MLIPTGRYVSGMTKLHEPVSKPETARNRLLNGALRIIREKGYHATSVDELCAAAGVTKGAFFHHFKSKEDLAVAAAEHWSMTTGGLFAAGAVSRVCRSAGPGDGLPRFPCRADRRALRPSSPAWSGRWRRRRF